MDGARTRMNRDVYEGQHVNGRQHGLGTYGTDVPTGMMKSEMRLQQPRAILIVLCMLTMQTLPATGNQQRATISFPWEFE